MAEYTVTGNTKTVNFYPDAEVEEILQNVRTILTTPKFSVPLDRSFGISGTVIDSIVNPEFISSLQAEIVTAVQTYEPRVEVTEVSTTADSDGNVYPVVKIRLKTGGESA